MVVIPTRRQLFQKLSPLEVTFIVGTLTGALFSAIAGIMFQPVSKHAWDYIGPWILAGLLAGILLIRARVSITSAAPPTAATHLPTLIVWVFLLGWWLRPSFLTLNAVLDRGPTSEFTGLIASVHCPGGRGTNSWTLVGAPYLPTPNDSMTITNAGCGQMLGDTVRVAVKPGLFGRAWIAHYAPSDPDARIARMIARIHAAVAGRAVENQSR